LPQLKKQNIIARGLAMVRGGHGGGCPTKHGSGWTTDPGDKAGAAFRHWINGLAKE